MLNARQASFLIGTTDQKNEKCIVCSQIYDLLNKIKGINDGRLFISHNILDTFYIWDPDHRNEVIDFTDQILALNSIKKLYILQVGSFKANLAYLKTFCLDDHLTYRKLLRTEFLGILNENGFENNILYEIVKDSY